MPSVVAVENFFSVVQFPAHVVAANEAADGHQAWRVATGRRSGLSYWAPTTANAEAWIRATFDQVRSGNYIALDRGHNLAGKSVELQYSSDSFATHTDVGFTVPTESATGSLDDVNGVLTPEGSWLARYAALSGSACRLVIPAMGTGLTPLLTGLAVGLALELEYVDAPFEDEHDSLFGESVVSDVGWSARAPIARRRNGELHLKLGELAEYEAIRYHLQQLYGAGSPAWIVHDVTQAERAICAVRPQGRMGFGFGSGDATWGYRSGSLPWEEWEPALP